MNAFIWFVTFFKFREYFTEIDNLEFSKIMELPNETHQKVLNNISRLCQQNLKLTSKYTSAEGKNIYRREIQKLFDSDINLDIHQLHPPFLCSRCQRKIKWWKDHSVTVERCQIATLEQLANTNCLVCHKKLKKFEFSVKLSKVDSTPTTLLHPLASENVQVQQLYLVEIQKQIHSF